jgi:hypothetical protein
MEGRNEKEQGLLEDNDGGKEEEEKTEKLPKEQEKTKKLPKEEEKAKELAKEDERSSHLNSLTTETTEMGTSNNNSSDFIHMKILNLEKGEKKKTGNQK